MVFIVYARLYGQCLVKAVQGALRNSWTLFLPIGLVIASNLLGTVLGPLGFVGGILYGVALDAIISCYLYFIGEIVSESRVRVNDFTRSFGAYFWAVMNLLFVIWIADFILAKVAVGPSGGALYMALYAVAFILLNATPEMIYQKGSYGGLATISGSLHFIQAHWIEWFIPNLLWAAMLYFLSRWVPPLPEALASWVDMVLLGALLHLGALFRGHLFQALDGSSHRQLMFKYRNATRPD